MSDFGFEATPSPRHTIALAGIVAAGIVGVFYSAASVGIERAKTERAALSVECAKNPVGVWKDDHCERTAEP